MSLDDELLRPTVDPRLDAVRFRPLWNPTSLLYGAFFGSIFGGAVAGGLIFGLNFHWMRRTALGVVSAALGFGATIAAAFLVGVRPDESAAAEAERFPGPREVRLGLMVFTAIFALAAARSQAPAFRVFLMAGGTPRQALWGCVPAAVFGFVFQVGLEFAKNFDFWMSRR